MKKVLIVLAVVVVLAAAVAVAVPAYAQEGDNPVYPHGGRGHGGGMYGDAVAMDGVLSDLIHANLAEALELTPADLTAREDAGETFVEIALAAGFSADEALDMQLQARLDALEEGVAQGLITQDQADWMADHWSSMPMYGYGSEDTQSYDSCWNDEAGERQYSENQSGRGGRYGR